MNMVYVNGMENNDIRMSDIERLRRNFQISDDILSPLQRTIIVMILRARETAAVVEYSTMRKTCHLSDSASKDDISGSETFIEELLLANVSDNQIGSIADGYRRLRSSTDRTIKRFVGSLRQKFSPLLFSYLSVCFE